VGVLTEHLADGARVVLGEDAGIADAAALHAALCELAGVAGDVVVDDSRVSAFDVTLLQLLVAFARARRAAGRTMRTAGGPPSRRLVALGLGADLGVGSG
jgi:hypothetical protein